MPVVLRRISVWSGALGVALLLAASALQAMGGPNPVRRGTLVVTGILFFPMIASLAVLVAALTGIWSLALSSDIPRPVMVGRASLWSGVLSAFAFVLPFVAVAWAPGFLVTVPVPLRALLPGISMLASLVAVFTGIASLMMSLIDRNFRWSGLVGFVLGALVLISPFLAILLYVFAYFSGGTRNF